MICKQLNEIKAIVAIDESQKIKAEQLGIELSPIICEVTIKSIKKGGGPYGIFINIAGEDFALGLQRGGIRGFSSVESAIKTCRTARLRNFSVEFSNIEMLRQTFSKEEDREGE